MKVTIENYNNLPIKTSEKLIIKALFTDLIELNEASDRVPLYIDWQDFHNECSPEWTDPCPDYYGYYTLRSSKTNQPVGFEMDIELLDYVLGTLYEFIIDEYNDLNVE